VAERIHGPYQHRSKWRVVGVRADGTRIRQSFDTREEAQHFADNARAALGQRSVAIAVSEYLEHMAAVGRRPSTVVTARFRLIAFLRLTEGDRLLAALTPAVAARLYAQRTEATKADTHRGELALASTWATWCVKRGYLAENPFGSVEPVGIRAQGKEQLRVDEARKWLAPQDRGSAGCRGVAGAPVPRVAGSTCSAAVFARGTNWGNGGLQFLSVQALGELAPRLGPRPRDAGRDTARLATDHHRTVRGSQIQHPPATRRAVRHPTVIARHAPPRSVTSKALGLVTAAVRASAPSDSSHGLVPPWNILHKAGICTRGAVGVATMITRKSGTGSPRK
jgi:hypothetical protein